MYFKAFKDPGKVMYVIKGERGGVVPEELQGKYTKKQFAEDAIRAYEVKNANKKSSVERSGAKGSTARKQKLQGSRSKER